MRPLGIAIGVVFVLSAATAAKEPAEGIVTRGPSTALEQADRNADGALDHAEFYERQVDVFFLIDTDKDGRVTVTELGEVERDAFVRCDRDKNGSLSLREFTAARFKDFGVADADDDEVLTATEIEAHAKTK
jgi:hypothetical protein